MTTASNGVALVATQLALTDRRALSQAWYSALHVAANDARSAPRTTARAAAAEPGRAPRPGRAVPFAHRGAGPQGVAGRRAAARESAAFAPNDRRRPIGEIARRVERAVAVMATVPKRRAAAHTIDLGGGRIRLLVRTDGRVTRVIALCASPLRERVERALAHARFTLAGNGAKAVG